MAKKSGGEQSSDELKAVIARSRERLGRDLRYVRAELDFPRKIRRSFRENTGTWVGAAVAVGTLLVLVSLRKKKAYVSANPRGSLPSKLVEGGFLLGLAKIAVALATPTVTKFLDEKFRAYTGGPRPSARK